MLPRVLGWYIDADVVWKYAGVILYMNTFQLYGGDNLCYILSLPLVAN